MADEDADFVGYGTAVEQIADGMWTYHNKHFLLVKLHQFNYAMIEENIKHTPLHHGSLLTFILLYICCRRVSVPICIRE